MYMYMFTIYSYTHIYMFSNLDTVQGWIKLNLIKFITGPAGPARGNFSRWRGAGRREGRGRNGANLGRGKLKTAHQLDE
jgi:hypothetical protein